jgi:hypothetical protein
LILADGDIFKKMMDILQGDIAFFPLATAERIIADPDSDPRQPVLEWRIGMELPQVLIDLYENILANVVQVVRIPGKTGCQPKNFPLVPADELNECFLFPGTYILDETFIRRFSGVDAHPIIITHFFFLSKSSS